jgi:hypothetical protein
LDNTEKTQIQAILATFPPSAVVALLDQWQGASADQQQALLNKLQSTDLVAAVNSSDAQTLLASYNSGGVSAVIQALTKLSGPTFAGQTFAPTTATVASTQSAETYHLDALGSSNTAALTKEINDSYEASFGRAPLPAELSYWLGQLPKTGWNEEQLIANNDSWLASSQGDQQRTQTVNSAFYNTLGRYPTDSELAQFSQTQQQTRNRYSNMVVVLTDQVRAHTAVGSATRADMVIRSYEQNFGRTPSQAELDLWSNRLLTGQYTDAQMVLDNQAYFKANTATQNGAIDAALYAVFGTNRAGVDQREPRRSHHELPEPVQPADRHGSAGRAATRHPGCLSASLWAGANDKGGGAICRHEGCQRRADEFFRLRGAAYAAANANDRGQI